MNFTEIVNEILGRTRRPDKLSSIRREVNSAVLFFSLDMDATRDVTEALYSVVANEYSQALPLSTWPRFRKFQYMKYPNTRNYIVEINAKKLYTEECKTADRYYVAGDNVNINLSTLTSQLDIGYYSYPPVLTDASPNYWLLDRAWNVVFDRACAKVYAEIDDDKASRMHEMYARDAWASQRNDLAAGSR